MKSKKKLNNRGMTLIEIIVCFVIVVVIVLSMFKMVNNYKDKQDIESYKSSITTYKNTITKVIWDDILNSDGMIGYQNLTDQHQNDTDVIFEYQFSFANGTTSILRILHNVVITDDADRISEDSKFYIEYGKVGEIERFEFPDIYNVQFNHPQVDAVTYTKDSSGDTKNQGRLFHIYIGVYDPDTQIGDQYNILDIYTPDVSDYYYALGGY